MLNNFRRGKEEVDLAPPAHVWDPRALQTHGAEVKQKTLKVCGSKFENSEKTTDLTELRVSPLAAHAPPKNIVYRDQCMINVILYVILYYKQTN